MHHCRMMVAGLCDWACALACLHTTVKLLVHSPNHLWQTSKNIYYIHIFMHIVSLFRVSHTLLRHSYISTTQLFDKCHFKQPEGLSSIQRCNRDCEWVLQRRLKEHVFGPAHSLYTHCIPCISGKAIGTLSIVVSVSVAPGSCHVWQRQPWCFCWVCERHRPARLSDVPLICKSVNAIHKVIDAVSMATM